jgi:cytochrome c-type biogenesis protein
MGAVSLSVALVGGAVAVFNPCAFPLLPAFLSFYIGADEERLPRATTRVLQGLLVGTLVTTGFLGLFALAGLPITLGIGEVARLVPWAGLATGVALTLLGGAAIAGISIRAPVRLHLHPRRERRTGAIVLFGVGYGAASLGCSLPIFLALIGASLGDKKIAVFAAYGIGMTVALLTLSVSVALLREGIVRCAKPLLPHVERAGGVLLGLSGTYLTYYWARIQFGDKATLADDPIVTFVTVHAARMEEAAAGHTWPLMAAVAALLAATSLSLVFRSKAHA